MIWVSFRVSPSLPYQRSFEPCWCLTLITRPARLSAAPASPYIGDVVARIVRVADVGQAVEVIGIVDRLTLFTQVRGDLLDQVTGVVIDHFGLAGVLVAQDGTATQQVIPGFGQVALGIGDLGDLLELIVVVEGPQGLLGAVLVLDELFQGGDQFAAVLIGDLAVAVGVGHAGDMTQAALLILTQAVFHACRTGIGQAGGAYRAMTSVTQSFEHPLIEFT